MPILIEDYRSTPSLDSELADLGYAAVHGWPDQRPVTPSMVRSLLRPGGMTATTLALRRDRDGRLVGAAALRWPATISASGRLWGPVVHPSARRGGIGRELLSTLIEVAGSHPGVRFTTTEIPESRAEGWKLFEQLGWRKETPCTLLARPLPAGLHVSTTVPVRAAAPGEYLDKALADLFALARPHLCQSIARDTFARWKADARYTSDGLLLTGDTDRLRGAVLVYPSRHSGPSEPAEALLSDILVDTKLDPADAAEIRTALVAAALTMADGSGAEVFRAVVDNPELRATLQAMGFAEVDRIRHYVSAQVGVVRRRSYRDSDLADVQRVVEGSTVVAVAICGRFGGSSDLALAPGLRGSEAERALRADAAETTERSRDPGTDHGEAWL